ncbi:hypothetical protein NYZ99_08705 [Maribacter litopenaei]|uniref:Uncharacterized protein n=1 Tax=Maribacter litopenaei TaxID=2976127 RepID=A0ABY5YBI7_9FLAO|nr:hypothetical protein [Maribacter litopenaei]UWX56284.1 hypothetical protein NYZ99_08705 [Maribacter litopenaei]
MGCHPDDLKEPREGQDLLILEAEEDPNNYPEAILNKMKLRQKRANGQMKTVV